MSAERRASRAERREPSAERRERWVINKLRALVSRYSKGLDNGGHLRIAINSARSIHEVRDIVDRFFFTPISHPSRVGAPVIGACARVVES